MPQKQRYSLFWLLLLLCMPLSLFSQQVVTITVLDKESKEPIPSAHLCFEDQKSGKQSYQVSDSKGQAIQSIQGPTALATSFIGYKTRMDTLTAGGAITLMLETSLFDMDEVVVTAQMSPKRADQSIYQVKVISNKLISDKAATNLSDVLAGELGLRVSKGGILGSTMSINGLSGEHIKILIDGVPVIGRLNGSIDLGQLNMNNVDHIEIVEGPMSVQYGSNALAGAINIITKENLRNKFFASANTYYESVGVYDANASINLNKNKHSFSLSGGRNFFDGFSRPDTARTQQWKPKLQYFTDGYYTLRKNDLKFRIDGKYFTETIQNKGNVRGKYEIYALDNYFITDRISSKAQLSGSIGEFCNFDIFSSWSGYKYIKDNYIKNMTTLNELAYYSDTTIFNTYLSKGTFAWQPEDGIFAIQTGLDLNYDKGEGKKIENYVQDMGDYAAFVSAQYNPTKKISIQPGLRIAYNTRYNAPLVPSLNLKWSPVNDLKLRFSYVRGFRSPSLKELYLYFVDINHNVKGNPDLQAEYSHTLNASFQYDKSINEHNFGLELNTFNNNVKNSINIVEVKDSTNLYTYANINEYHSLGYNFKLKYQLHPRLNLAFGISQTGTLPVTSQVSQKSDSYYISTDYVGEFRYDLFKYGINLSAFYKFNGKYPYYSFNSNNEVEVGIVDSYGTLDITLNKTFLNKTLVLSMGGKNLFDITEIPITGANGGAHANGDDSPVGWGRTFFLGLNYKFGTF
jgi:outer membrane receptor for ferrienterochelin and colicins